MEESRALPRRQLPPLTDTSAVIDADELLSATTAEPKARKRSPQKKPARESPRLTEAEQSPRTLPSFQQGDQQPPSAETSVASKSARTRRRQANKRAQRSPRERTDIIANGHAITKILSDDDVVPVEQLEANVAMTPLPGVANHGVISQQHDKIYVQTNSGFTSRTHDWLANRASAARRDGEDADLGISNRASDVASNFHRGFLTLTLLLHGLLAGIAVWEVVVAFLLNAEPANFPARFGILAQPLQTTFFILLVFCLVAAMDRFNLSKHGKIYFTGLIKANAQAWMVFFYFLSFMFNVGLTGLDKWLATFDQPVNSTLTSDFLSNNLASSVTTWHVINVLRASCSVIGYFLIAFQPTVDDVTAASIEDLFAHSVGGFCASATTKLNADAAKNNQLQAQLLLKTARLIVLTVMSENVWSDERREFICNTKQPGCENVCFNQFAPVSNVRLWALQILAVSVPAALYFVYVMHAVSKQKNRKEVGCSEEPFDNRRPSKSAQGDAHRDARARWRKLKNHVIPNTLQNSRERAVFRLYVVQIVARVMLEGVFVTLQFTVYTYKWTVPEVHRCSRWPCPHTVDCFVSRPREKTFFFRYMLVVAALSALLSLAELCHIACVRRITVWRSPRLQQRRASSTDPASRDFKPPGKCPPEVRKHRSVAGSDLITTSSPTDDEIDSASSNHETYL